MANNSPLLYVMYGPEVYVNSDLQHNMDKG